MASKGALARVTLQSGLLITPQAVAPPDEALPSVEQKSLMDLLFGTTLAKPAGRASCHR